MTTSHKKKFKLANKRIDAAFLALQESNKNVASAIARHRRFIAEQYSPAIHEINSRYDQPLAELKGQIDPLSEKVKHYTSVLMQMEMIAVQRAQFLDTAAKKLKNFKQILKDHQGLYIPSEQIPQAELLHCMECSQAGKEFIDKMYTTAKAASGLRGIFSNFRNKFSHHTTLLGPSDFDLDMSELMESIDARLKQISDEQTVKIDETVPQRAPANLELESNLYTLSAFYQNAQELLNDNNARLEPLQQSYDELAAGKERELLIWETRNNEQEIENHIINLQHQLAKFNLELALLAANYRKLHGQLVDIQGERYTLSTLVVRLINSESSEAQALYESHRDQFADFEKILDAKKEPGEHSPKELAQRISSQLASLAKRKMDCAQILSHFDEQFAEYAGMKAELEKLEGRGQDLIESMRLLQDIPQLKMTFDRLGELAQIESECSLLLTRSQVEDLSTEGKLQLAELIESAISKHSVTTALIQDSNKNINEKIGRIDLLINGEDGLLQFVALTRLDQIKSKYLALGASIRRLEAKRQATCKESKLVADRIAEAMRDDSIFLTYCQTISLPKVQESLDNLSVIEENLNNFCADPYIYVPVPPAFDVQIDQLINDKFGISATEIGGEFGAYLEERAQVFAVNDYINLFLALVFGFLGYKTESEKRKDYLIELSGTIKKYQDGDTKDTYGEVMSKITEGKTIFPPRAKRGDEYDKSLSAKLDLLKSRLESIERFRCQENDLDIHRRPAAAASA